MVTIVPVSFWKHKQTYTFTGLTERVAFRPDVKFLGSVFLCLFSATLFNDYLVQCTEIFFSFLLQ